MEVSKWYLPSRAVAVNIGEYGVIRHVFERLFVISWENNRDCHITMPLSLKTMEVQIKGGLWNKRFRTVQVYCEYDVL